MAKSLVLLIVIASIFVPIVLAERPRPRATMRLLIFIMLAIIFIWSQLCLRVYPTMVPVD